MATETSSLAAFDPRNSKMQDIMAKYRVTPADLTAPVPHVTEKVNLDQICTETTPVLSEAGQNLNAKAHTGPLMYLATKRASADDNPNFKSKYNDYVGFYVYTFGHPIKGEIVCTHGIPKTGPTELSEFIATLNP